nr:putative CCA tRNA nucleotidyltransferase 2 isoform X1 [Tanacetum cinerariifolium]
MKFGSTEQDTYRRDLTIHSLYYHINTCLVEDLTCTGLDDLKCGLLLDKSPRVVRAIRFSARFEFEMVEELKAAAANEGVKYAIAIFFADKLVESGLVIRLIL